jgi:hypothetical protein
MFDFHKNYTKFFSALLKSSVVRQYGSQQKPNRASKKPASPFVAPF